MSDDEDFERELASVINRFSRENYSNTPDFILAAYLNRCLKAFEQVIASREKWYGASNHIGGERDE